MTELARAIKALERMRGTDGTLELDREQAQYLVFLLWVLHEGSDERYSALDLLGVLDAGEERGA